MATFFARFPKRWLSLCLLALLVALCLVPFTTTVASAHTLNTLSTRQAASAFEQLTAQHIARGPGGGSHGGVSGGSHATGSHESGSSDSSSSSGSSSGSHIYVNNYHYYGNSSGNGSFGWSWSGCLVVVVIISIAVLWLIVASKRKANKNPDNNPYYNPKDTGRD